MFIKSKNANTLKVNLYIFFEYFLFLFKQTIKKRVVLITWFVYLFFIFLFLFLIPLLAQLNVLNIWANSTFVFCQSLLNITIAIFTAILAINIIKFQQKDTTELVLTSKPLSRFKMVLCRFFIFFIICILVNLSTSAIALLSNYVPDFDKQYVSNLFCSMLVGNLINFGIYGAIAVVATLIFKKNTIILINTLFNIIFFVWQTITLFAIKIPILQAITDEVIPQTITVAQREISPDTNFYDKEYSVKQLVSFTLPASKQDTAALIGQPNNDAIRQYWETKQKEDPNRTLNLIDIGSQLTLAYDSCNLQSLINKQAQRTFGISKFHDYNLTNTASPEILSTNQYVDWLYIGEQKFNVDGYPLEFVLPNYVYFFGEMDNSVSNVLKNQTFKEFAIGELWSTSQNRTKYVDFPPEKWQLYLDGFKEIYKNIFIDTDNLKTDNDENYFQRINNRPADWSNNTNISKYYELIWYCLAKKPQNIIENWDGNLANKNTFEVSSLEDLNTRFIQFKHYVYWELLSEQKKMFSNPSDDEAMIISRYSASDNLIFQPNEDNQKSWYITPQPGNENFLDPNAKTPALFIMNWEQANSYNQYTSQTKILRNCVANEELHLFDSLDEPHRSNKHRGKHFMVQLPYVPWSVTNETYFGHNLGLFFYESQSRINITAFCLVWFLISLSLYSLCFIIYQKHDIQ